MQIFLSYASEDHELSEEIQLALCGAGYKVFFDETSLPAGGDYHSRISNAVRIADLFVFLISPNSIAPGSYALTELKYARRKWPHPNERILPVRLHNTDWDRIPPYLKSVTVLEPEGNIPAEIRAAIEEMAKSIEQSLPHIDTNASVGNYSRPADSLPITDTTHKTVMWIVILSLVAVIATFLFLYWPKVSGNDLSLGGLKGSDSVNGQSPVLNTECHEVTVYDYSKMPPESKVIQDCEQKQ